MLTVGGVQHLQEVPCTILSGAEACALVSVFERLEV